MQADVFKTFFDGNQSNHHSGDEHVYRYETLGIDQRFFCIENEALCADKNEVRKEA
ncbi:Uncharacterised protein [Vibrio cholerae]|uniref:Uncharacterized protein n=1 Tax=Vibrio cholerae TaxID=666 RepID=A0A655TN73_VIBCL|nr:Uncharacterised protein [Vibrio cholerae]CSB37708.1 Uncharacterised protein [Vibrio cholerae]CSD07333.1 Uncharacterised protein [Vibrio cholerae]CSD09472.1 Uncharacterised protein [Vibrio cholerae]